MLSKPFIFGIVIPSLILCWTAMNAYGAIAGQSGYRELTLLQEDVRANTEILDALRARRVKLQKRADQLNPKSLDPDLIDEKIRSILGYSRDGDMVISRKALDEILAQNRQNDG